MSISLVLEVAISMVFLYLLGSQVVLSIYELWTGYLNKRGKFLYKKLKGTLGTATTQKLYAQPNISALTPAGQSPPTSLTEGTLQWRLGKDGLPAYIPADLFSSTLLALVAPTAATNANVQSELVLLPVVVNATTTLTDNNSPWLTENTKGLLTQLLSGLPPTATLADCQKSVALWYDAYGERLTGWYKRRVRGWLALLGLLLAIFVNIDSLHILRYLWLHPQVSHRIADTAGGTHRPPPSGSGNQNNPTPRPMTPDRQDSLILSKLKASIDTANALHTRLAKLGFPIGRADTLAVDSMALPTPFYIRQPKRTVHVGKKTYSIGAHYLRYTRVEAKATSSYGVAVDTVHWVKALLSPQQAGPDTIGTRNRTSVVSDTKFSLEKWLSPQPNAFWGWLVTALALSVGAPFWFDLLCRLVNIRNLGTKPAKADK
jgi:hypothetical protein